MGPVITRLFLFFFICVNDKTFIVSGVAVAGTAHGLAVFDIVRQVPICVKCTLNPSGESVF